MRKKAQTIIMISGYDWKAGGGSETFIKSYIPFTAVETFYKLMEESDDEDEFNLALLNNKDTRKYMKKWDYYSQCQWSVREFIESHQVGSIKTIYTIDDNKVSERQWDNFSGGGFNHWSDDYVVEGIHSGNSFSFGDNM